MKPLTLVLLNCFYCIFRHLKLELLTQFPASNFWKYRSSKLNYLTDWASTTNCIIHFSDIIVGLNLLEIVYNNGRSRTRAKNIPRMTLSAGQHGMILLVVSRAKWTRPILTPSSQSVVCICHIHTYICGINLKWLLLTIKKSPPPSPKKKNKNKLLYYIINCPISITMCIFWRWLLPFFSMDCFQKLIRLC